MSSHKTCIVEVMRGKRERKRRDWREEEEADEVETREWGKRDREVQDRY